MGFHNFYYQSTGKFFVNYLPDDLYYCDIDMYFNDWDAGRIIDNKCFYDVMFPNVKHPETFARRINNLYYDENNKLVTLSNILEKAKKEEKLFVKIAVESAGGHGVYFIENKNNDIDKKINEILNLNKKDIIIQRPIEQHETLAKLNKSSVNTIRVLSLLRENEVKIYSCILRMGIGKSKVDNASSGGITCGIDNNGYLKDVAYFTDGTKYKKHPTSGIEFSKIQVPKYKEILNTVIENHPLIPHFRLVSWDFAVDKDGNVVLIEANLKYGELDFHQLNNGPLFGEDTKKILDEVYGKNI